MTAQAGETRCEVFSTAKAGGPSLKRFLVGLDGAPRKLEAAELESDLNDPFAVHVLRKGTFPGTPQDVLSALDDAIGPEHALGRGTQRSFVVAEGSQVAKDPARSFRRGLRFMLTRGQGPDGPDLMISTSHPESPSVEVMAWDDQRGGFNYYRTLTRDGAERSWVWAGNSRHAWERDTRASGPFESHPTGNLLFKELKLPWVHWHGPPAIIDGRDLPAGDDLASHPWFSDKQGAYVLEDSVAKPAISRWNRRRLAQVQESGVLVDPVQVMERFLGSREPRRATVNLVSSRDSNEEVKTAQSVRLPLTFFVDFDTLTGVLGLAGPDQPMSVPGSHYRDALSRFEVAVRNHDQEHPLNGDEPFERPGDTHFVFLVPERAFEDVDFVRQMIKPQPQVGEPELGLVSERLAGCLLMVDFPNPVFSRRRVTLLKHVPEREMPDDEWPAFSQELGDRIAAAATGEPETAAENEFALLWSAGDGWRTMADERLRSYYGAPAAQLQSLEGFANLFQLAEARRDHVRRMPLNEMALLFAQTNIPRDSLAGLALTAEATIESRG